MQIQVVPPVIVNLPDLNQLCSGSPVNALLSANVPSTYSWFVSLDNPEVVGESLFPSTGNLISDVLVNTSDVNQLVVYSITPTSVLGACLGQAQAIAVIVKPPIEFLNASDVQICSGTPVDLELVTNTDVNFTWFAESTPWAGGESTGINSVPTIGDVLTNTTSEPQSVFYSVVGTSTSDGCSSPVATMVVSVLPLPPVAALGNTVYCPGDAVPAREIVGPVEGVVYNWVQTGENVGSTVYSGTGIIPSFIAVNTGALPALATITVTASLTSGGLVCTGVPETYTVQVNPTPATYALPDIEVCEGVYVPPVAPSGPVSGTTWQWLFTSPQLGLLPQGASPIPGFVASNPSLIPLEGVVTALPFYTSAGVSCFGNSSSYMVRVNPAPQVSAPDADVCSGSTVAVQLNADLASTFSWYAVPQGNVIGETSFPAQSGDEIVQLLSTEALFDQTVTYQVTATDVIHGCVSLTTPIPIAVHPLPQLNFSVLNPSLCELQPVYFSNNSPGVLAYTWSFGDGTTSVADDPVHSFPATGEYDVTLTGSDPVTGCTNEIAQEVEIGVIPDAEFIVSDSVGCGTVDASFLAFTQDSSLTYLWDFGDGAQSTQIGMAGNQFAPTGCFDVTLTVTNAAGCAGQFTVEEAVCAFPEPNAAFTADPYTTTTLDPEIEFTNESNFATSYHWDFGDGSFSYDPNPVHLYEGYGTFQVVLVASNGTVCEDEARVSIVVNPDLGIYVPNAFTPGTLGPGSNDGLNDAFKPVISDPSLLVYYHFQIFDRWGNVIWESFDPDEWWTGSVAPIDDYYVNNDMYTWRLHVKTTWSENDIISYGQVTVVK